MTALQVRAYREQDLGSLTQLWNVAATAAHGFFPLRAADLAEHFTVSFFNPEQLLLGFYDQRLVAFLHYDLIRVAPYPCAGTIAAVATHPDYRRRGLATTLLATAIAKLTHTPATFIDALGAWPYSSFYTGLIGGSERAGIAAADVATLGLFRKFSFVPGKRSLLMRARLTAPLASAAVAPQAVAAPLANLVWGTQSRRLGRTWLDVCFRRWTASNYALRSPAGEGLSYAIAARWRGYSEFYQREIYSVYGVMTPEEWRRRGYARENFRRLMNYLAVRGARELELQVYADNAPAVALYRGLGFMPQGEAVALRRALAR
jgi:ribosomal protein S18 acetylase RimI-like enzyme